MYKLFSRFIPFKCDYINIHCTMYCQLRCFDIKSVCCTTSKGYMIQRVYLYFRAWVRSIGQFDPTISIDISINIPIPLTESCSPSCTYTFRTLAVSFFNDGVRPSNICLNNLYLDVSRTCFFGWLKYSTYNFFNKNKKFSKHIGN